MDGYQCACARCCRTATPLSATCCACHVHVLTCIACVRQRASRCRFAAEERGVRHAGGSDQRAALGGGGGGGVEAAERATGGSRRPRAAVDPRALPLCRRADERARAHVRLCRVAARELAQRRGGGGRPAVPRRVVRHARARLPHPLRCAHSRHTPTLSAVHEQPTRAYSLCGARTLDTRPLSLQNTEIERRRRRTLAVLDHVVS
eukprot:3006647-Pleurochrysis_carterae.AAC.3